MTTVAPEGPAPATRWAPPADDAAAQTASDEAPARRWEAPLLALVLVAAGALRLGRLDLQGLGNPYYAATVRSMLLDGRNLLFASFDPAGFVSVDKPPLGFWIQAASAAIGGFDGTSLILPQAVAGIVSVGLVWAIARRVFGPAAAIVAAAALALTPVAVAADRTNTIDPLLVCCLLLASGAALRAVSRGSLGWLLASAALIGLGFNVKMLQAFLVVPAWGLVWLLGARVRLRRRAGWLAAATALLLAVSFAWATLVQLTPPDRRPWVGSSTTNSVFDLAFGYNGLQRLLPPSLTGGAGGADAAAGSAAPPSPGAILQAFGGVETGERGPLRLFNRFLAAQASWLLPFALLGGAAAWWQEPARPVLPLSRRRAALVLFGGWLLTAAAFFSVANQFHRYYLVMLGPPIAVLVGAGATALWADYRRPGWRGWLLPAGVLGSALLAAAFAAPFPVPGAIVARVAVGFGVAAAAALVLLRPRAGGDLPAGRARRAAAGLAAAAAVVALLAGPAAWSAWSLLVPVSNVLPAAGPGGSIFPQAALGAPPVAAAPGSDGPSDGAPGGKAGAVAATPPAAAPPGPPAFDRYLPPDPALAAFLEANRGDARFALATANSLSAAPLVIERAMPVAALGGFIGQDPILSVSELRAMVARGEVRFFLVPDPGRVNLLSTMVGALDRIAGGDDPALPSFAPPGADPGALPAGQDPSAFLRLFLTDNVRWVTTNCDTVPPARWQSPDRAAANPLAGLERLYDCGALHEP